MSAWNQRNPERVREARRRYNERQQRLRRNGMDSMVLDRPVEDVVETEAVVEQEPTDVRETEEQAEVETVEEPTTEAEPEAESPALVVWTQEEHDRILRAADLVIKWLSTTAGRRATMSLPVPETEGLVRVTCDKCGMTSGYPINQRTYCHFCGCYPKVPRY